MQNIVNAINCVYKIMYNDNFANNDNEILNYNFYGKLSNTKENKIPYNIS